jgi:hypothetical protein
MFRNSKKTGGIFRFLLWKKISTIVDNVGNLLIIGRKRFKLRGVFRSTDFSPQSPRSEYLQGNYDCGKLQLAGIPNWPKPNLTTHRFSG